MQLIIFDYPRQNLKKLSFNNYQCSKNFLTIYHKELKIWSFVFLPYFSVENIQLSATFSSSQLDTFNAFRYNGMSFDFVISRFAYKIKIEQFDCFRDATSTWSLIKF